MTIFTVSQNGIAPDTIHAHNNDIRELCFEEDRRPLFAYPWRIWLLRQAPSCLRMRRGVDYDVPALAAYLHPHNSFVSEYLSMVCISPNVLPYFLWSDVQTTGATRGGYPGGLPEVLEC